MFNHNCEKCGFGCMAEALFISHRERCEVDMTEQEQMRLVRVKQRQELEDA